MQLRSRVTRGSEWILAIRGHAYGGAPKLDGDDSALRCTMRQTGITCQNAEHGFKLASGTHETF